MLKRFQIVLDAPRSAIQRLDEQIKGKKMSLKNAVSYNQFLKKVDEQYMLARTVYTSFKDQLEDKDLEVSQEWMDFLNTDVEIDQLPKSLFEKTEEISPEDYRLLESLIEKE